MPSLSALPGSNHSSQERHCTLSDKRIRTHSRSARGNTSEDTGFRSDTPHAQGEQPKQAWVAKRVWLSNPVIIRHNVFRSFPNSAGDYLLGLS
jgi:hypothetical protein